MLLLAPLVQRVRVEASLRFGCLGSEDCGGKTEVSRTCRVIRRKVLGHSVSVYTVV